MYSNEINIHNKIKSQFPSSALAMALSPLLVVATSASAELIKPEATLETIAITATKSDKTLFATDSIVSEDLDDPSVHDIASALENQTSITLSRRQSGDVKYPEIRGLGENYVDLTIDGIQKPSYFTYGHYFHNTGELNSIEIDTIKQIDVVKGRQSPKQSSGALAGSVNLRTYRPSDFVSKNNPTYASIQSGYTSSNEDFGNTLTGAFSKGDLSTMIMYSNRNFHELENQGKDIDKTLRNEVDSKQNNILLKGQFDITKGTLIATGEYFDLDRTTKNRYRSLPESEEPAKRIRLSLEGEFDDVIGLDELNTNFSYQESENNSMYSTTVGDFKHNYWGASVDAAKIIETGNLDHGLIFGLGFNRNEFDFTTKSTKTGNISRPNPITTRDTTFAYAKDNITFKNGLILAPGLRVEHKQHSSEVDNLYTQNPAVQFQGFIPESNETIVTPSVGFILPINDSVEVYASYSEGSKSADDTNFTSFKHPLRGGRSFFIIPNPELKDEESKNYELGVKYQPNNKINFSLNGFNTNYDNFIAGKMAFKNGSMVFEPYNIGKVDTYGLELETNAELNDKLTAHLGATWINGETKSGKNDGKPLLNTTPLLAVIGLDYKANETWGSSLNVKVAGEGKDPENKDAYRTHGFGVTDISAWWQPMGNVTVSGGVYNVFDKKYWNATDVNGSSLTSRGQPVNFDVYTMPGRNYGVKIKYEF